MVDSLLIAVVTTGVIRLEVLDWIPSFLEKENLADAAEIKRWELIPLCHYRDRQCRNKKSLEFSMSEQTQRGIWLVQEEVGMWKHHPCSSMVLQARDFAQGAAGALQFACLGCTSRDV